MFIFIKWIKDNEIIVSTDNILDTRILCTSALVPGSKDLRFEQIVFYHSPTTFE